MTRLALLTEVPAPFRTPLFNALAERVELDVLFLAEHDPRRAYGLEPEAYRFRYGVLPGLGLTRSGSWIVVNVGASRALRRARPDVVLVGGWNQPAFWGALAWARRRGVPVVAWVESTARDARSGAVATERAKRAFVRRCEAFVVPGRASAAYLRSLGVQPERIAVAPNAVDLSAFRDQVAELQRERERLRAERGLTRTTFLTVARLSPEKGVDVLLRAFGGLDADLVVAGSGPEERRLRALAPPEVRFLGHVEGDELLAWYACADAFVLPSRSETWGMVLNEAAAAGLPLIATEAVGAAWDLVDEGINGFLVPSEDANALREALRCVAGDEAFHAAAGARSHEIVAPFTPGVWATSVLELLERLVRRGGTV